MWSQKNRSLHRQGPVWWLGSVGGENGRGVREGWRVGKVGEGRGRVGCQRRCLQRVRRTGCDGGTVGGADHAFVEKEAVQRVTQRREERRVQGPVAQLRLLHALQQVWGWENEVSSIFIENIYNPISNEAGMMCKTNKNNTMTSKSLLNNIQINKLQRLDI